MHNFDHHQVLHQEYAYICSSALCRTWRCAPQYEIPIHHLHSIINSRRIKILLILISPGICLLPRVEIINYKYIRYPSSANYLMAIYVSKYFFTIFCSKHGIKMPCDIQAHDLQILDVVNKKNVKWYTNRRIHFLNLSCLVIDIWRRKEDLTLSFEGIKINHGYWYW